MSTISESPVRELDSRSSDGIDVRLLWDPRTGGVSVAVADGRSGEQFEVAVAAADALAAFHHPYAYVAHAAVSRSAFTHTHHQSSKTGGRS